MRTVQLSGTGINRSCFDRAGEIIHGQSTGSKPRWIGFDSNGALNAVDVYLRYTRQDGDALRHRSGRIFIEISVGECVREQPEQINRLVVGICFCERRRAGQIDRQFPGCALDRRLHICGRINDTFAEIELKGERGISLRARARDDVEPRNLEELLFQRRGDVVRHCRWVRPRI